MKYYEKLDSNKYITGNYRTTNNNKGDKEISEDEYAKIKWKDGKRYRMPSEEVIEEDDPDYEVKELEKAKDLGISRLQAITLKKIVEADPDYIANKSTIRKAKTIKEIKDVFK